MTSRPGRKTAQRLLVPAMIAGVIIASAILIGTTGWLLWHSGQRAIQNAISSTQNLTAVLDRHAMRMIDSVEIVMKTAGRQLGPDIGDKSRRSFLDAWLADIARDLPHLHSVGVLDLRSGTFSYDFVRSREPGPELYAEIMSSAPAGTGEPFHVGRAVFDTASQGWLLPLSRRIPPHQGSNEALIVVTLSLNYLQELYASLDIGADGTVVLFRSDGEILARSPYDATRVGQSVPNGLLFREHLPRMASGTFRTQSVIDGVERIMSYRRLGSTALVAVVSLSVSEVLAKWREDMSTDLMVAGFCAMMLLGLGLVLIRIVRQRDRADSYLHATLEHIDQGLLMVGPNQRTKVYNRRALELLDLPDELMARRPSSMEVFAYQEARGEFAATPPELRNRIVQPLLAGTPACYERVRPNGTVLEIRTNPLPNGGAVRTYTDITERRKAIEDMNASMAFANSLVNSSPDCIQLLDLEGNITFISDLGQELFEIEDIDTVRGRPFSTFFPQEHHSRVELALRRVRNGQTDRFTRMCPTLGGIPKWWDFIITPVHEIGRTPERLFVVARDISARQAHAEELSRAKEAAERASVAKSQFLASMSHEIRTPLNAILGFAALARERQSRDPELRRQMELIQKAGESLLTIINDVLDLAKVEAGKIELEERPLDLQGLVEDCLSLTRGLAEQKGIALHCVVAAATPARIVADEARLRQVLLNLLNNAVKFTHAGEVLLKVDPAPAGDRMAISISDTGIGISQERIEHLFQDFVQGDGSISRQYGGTGLGLSISRRLITLMGGEIGVTSVLGEGSTFHFHLPLIEAQPEAGLPSQGRAEEPGGFVMRSILLVDDLSINLEIVSEMLGSAGHRVTVASNGPSAISLYREHRHDLILMDVQMPDMDGLETTRQIRDIDAQARDVPVIALTANVFSQQIESYREAGMNDHLGKPFHRDALLAMVARWAGQRVGAERSEAPTEETPPLLDCACQLELSGLIGVDKTWELLLRFRDDLPGRLRSASTEALRADAHAIVSTSGLLGFARLSAAARELEQTIDAGGDIALALSELLAARKATMECVAGLLSTLESGASATQDIAPAKVA